VRFKQDHMADMLSSTGMSTILVVQLSSVFEMIKPWQKYGLGYVQRHNSLVNLWIDSI